MALAQMAIYCPMQYHVNVVPEIGDNPHLILLLLSRDGVNPTDSCTRSRTRLIFAAMASV